MGVDAQAILTSAPDLRHLMFYTKRRYKSVKAMMSTEVDFFWITFKDGDDDRMMSCFFDNFVACDYKDLYTGNATFVTVGKWGNSSSIMRGLVAEFGGWVREDDCNGDWKRLDED